MDQDKHVSKGDNYPQSAASPSPSSGDVPVGTIAARIEFRLSNEFDGAVTLTGRSEQVAPTSAPAKLKYGDYFKADGTFTDKMAAALEGARTIAQLSLQIMKDARAGLIKSLPVSGNPQMCGYNTHECDCEWQQYWDCSGHTCEWRWRWVCDCCRDHSGGWA